MPEEVAPWRLDAGSASRALVGEARNGDSVFSWSDGPRALFAVIDALGHGPIASDSAALAAATLHRFAGRPLGELFVQVHAALEGHRGVVMSAIHIDGPAITFAGVGNVELAGAPDANRPPCTPGVLGSGRLYLRPAHLAVSRGTRWGLVSDGICQRELRPTWDAATALGPRAAAQYVLERAGRDDDDASVLVLDFDGAAP